MSESAGGTNRGSLVLRPKYQQSTAFSKTQTAACIEKMRVMCVKSVSDVYFKIVNRNFCSSTSQI